MGRFILGCFVVGAVLIYFGIQENSLASAADEKPQVITCEQLATAGPGDNAHVTLTDFVLWTDAFVYEEEGSVVKKWSRVWIPAVPEGGEAHQAAVEAVEEFGRNATIPPPKNIRIIVQANAANENEVERLAERDALTGLVINRISDLGSEERGILEQSYPGVDFDHVWIIQEGRKPASGAKVAFMIGLGVLGCVIGLVLAVVQVGKQEKAAQPAPGEGYRGVYAQKPQPDYEYEDARR